MDLIKFVNIFLIVLFLSGCISRLDYPNEWPDKSPVMNGCPDISGIYLNEGIAVEANASQRLSRRPFFDHANAPLTSELWNYFYVGIEKGDPGKYVVSFYNEEGSQSEYAVEIDTKDEPWSCDNGEMVYSDHPPSVGYSHGAYGRWTDEVRISKTVDGSLLLKQVTSAMLAYFYVIPGYFENVELQLHKLEDLEPEKQTP